MKKPLEQPVVGLLRSLITPGYLVRSPSGYHGMVSDFDAHSNIVTVQFGADGPFERYHFSQLRAGNDDTELHVTGTKTKDFPKQTAVRIKRTARALPRLIGGENETD